MQTSPKRSNNYMCRISNIDYLLPPKKKICNIFNTCVGEVYWIGGNKETLYLVKPDKRPSRNRGLFFA